MSIQADIPARADALPATLERTGGSRWQQAAARSEQDRCDAAAPPYDRGGVILAASAWLALYAIAAIYYAIDAIHHLIASGISN
jgi:hypothetical protein